MDFVDGPAFNKDIGYERKLNVTYTDSGSLQFITYTKNPQGYAKKYQLFIYRSTWRKLFAMADTIKESMPKYIAGCDKPMKVELSKDIFLTMNKDYLVVDIRKFWRPEGDHPVPTKNAVSLKYVEFRKLLSHADKINELMLGV